MTESKLEMKTTKLTLNYLDNFRFRFKWQTYTRRENCIPFH